MTKEEHLTYAEAWEENIITFSHPTCLNDFYYCVRRTLSVYADIIQREIDIRKHNGI